MRDHLLSAVLDQYVQHLSAGYHPVLEEMEQYGYERDFPIIGPQVGRLLYLLTQLKNPSSIFEMGSGYGYSTLWFALGSRPDTEIHHTDTDPENIRLAREYLGKARITSQVIFHPMDGMEALKKQIHEGRRFDIIFCDIEKKDYPAAFKLAKEGLKSGGIFIADNILWKGFVADASNQDEETSAIRYATTIFTDDPSFFTSILSVRDGVLVAMKKQG